MCDSTWNTWHTHTTHQKDMCICQDKHTAYSHATPTTNTCKGKQTQQRRRRAPCDVSWEVQRVAAWLLLRLSNRVSCCAAPCDWWADRWHGQAGTLLWDATPHVISCSTSCHLRWLTSLIQRVMSSTDSCDVESGVIYEMLNLVTWHHSPLTLHASPLTLHMTRFTSYTPRPHTSILCLNYLLQKDCVSPLCPRVADPLSKSCLGDPPTLFPILLRGWPFFEKFNTEMVRGSTARRP